VLQRKDDTARRSDKYEPVHSPLRLTQPTQKEKEHPEAAEEGRESSKRDLHNNRATHSTVPK